MLLEAFYGWQAESLALLADAAHNLGDVAGLVLAWAGMMAGRARADERFTYGFKRLSLWAALGNAVLILVGMGALIWEAIDRLWLQQVPVAHSMTVIVVAALGILVNGATALLFLKGRHDDLNIRGAFWHMAGDALVSAGVVVAGALTWWMGWTWVDPVASLAISLVIVWGTWQLLRQSVCLLLDAVPAHISLKEVRAYLLKLPGVTEVPDLHVWAMGSAQTALTAHLVIPSGVPGDAFLLAASEGLREHFGIGHVTLQPMQRADHAPCPRQ